MTESATGQEKDYEILGEDYPSFDYSFKIIVIGNSGKYIFLKKYNNRSWEIIIIYPGFSTYFC